jgi:cytochrome b6-f complex iron-sulfur subunit
MNNISRGQFIKTIKLVFASTGLVAIVAPVMSYLYPSHLEETPSTAVFVAKLEELLANESWTVLYGRYPAIVVNTTQGLKGYSAVCTHFACIVKWNKQINQFACPCHAGFYDPLDGHVISGPPPRPLASIPINIQDGKIYLGEQL